MADAIDCGRADVVQLLLQEKVDIEALPFGSGKRPALMEAFERTSVIPEYQRARARILDLLLAAGANPNAPGVSGESALWVASGGGSVAHDPEMVVKLLKLGADPKARFLHDGTTLLMGPAAGHLGVLKLLIAAGADPYATRADGATPLHFVCALGGDATHRYKTLEPDDDPEAAQRIMLLLKRGIDINQAPTPGFVGNPLLTNLRNRNPDCVAALIKAGASVDAVAYRPDAKLQRGWTVLQIARDNAFVSREVKKVLEDNAKLK
ncbi:MAG: hypothetical protein RLZZ618_2397 [Pseudomonadota bacterium]